MTVLFLHPSRQVLLVIPVFSPSAFSLSGKPMKASFIHAQRPSRPQVPASTFLRMQATRARDVQRHPSNSTSFLDRSLPRQYASIRCGAFIEEDAKSEQSKGVRIKIGREDLQRNNSKYKMRKTPKAGKLKCFGILLLVGQGTCHTSSRFSTAQPLDSDIVMPA